MAVTLQEFVKQHGTHKAAARVIGTTRETISRWLRGKFTPDPLTRRALEAVGIDPSSITARGLRRTSRKSPASEFWEVEI